MPFQLWHQRFGHLNRTSLSKTLKDLRIEEPLDIQSYCISCLKGRMSKAYNKGLATRASIRLELIHSDLCGPFPIQSISGARYFIIFVDDATRYTWVYFLKTKTALEVIRVFQEFKALVEKASGHSIKRFSPRH